MQVVVTGGAGFIGSHLVERLLADGCRVRVLDDFSSGKPENLPVHDRLSVVTGDVGNYEDVQRCLDGAALVLHEAAIASVPKTIDDPLGSHRTNYIGTLNVLEAARRLGIKRVVFAASAAAYGDLPGLPKQEEMPVRPLSPYAVDKLASEHACRMYFLLHGLETVCLRYFNVYGPRQDPSSPYSGVISLFASKLERGEQPTIYGDGEQTRDFVYVKDVVEANIKALYSRDAPGRVFNIGSGSVTSVNRLLETMCGIKGRGFAPRYLAQRVGDVRHSCADIGLARNVLGWKPAVELDAGLSRLLREGAGVEPDAAR